MCLFKRFKNQVCVQPQVTNLFSQLTKQTLLKTNTLVECHQELGKLLKHKHRLHFRNWKAATIEFLVTHTFVINKHAVVFGIMGIQEIR